jgi:hypothetical protein
MVLDRVRSLRQIRARTGMDNERRLFRKSHMMFLPRPRGLALLLAQHGILRAIRVASFWRCCSKRAAGIGPPFSIRLATVSFAFSM